MKSIRLLAFIASGASFLLIVLGGWVRISGSGMGCGDDWPLCNGQLIPSLSDPATFIEWSHRLVAFAISALVVGVAVLGYRRRQDPKVSGAGGPLRPAVLAVALMLVQVLLGAITVWMELPAAAVILHLGTAMAMVAALLVAGLNAGQRQVDTEWTGAASTWRSAVVALVLAGVAVLMGGLTANMGAAGSCMGFPLCNGQIFPTGGSSGLSHIHWFHRLVAYGLTLHLIGMAIRVARRKAPMAVRRVTMVAMAVTVIQIVVGAGMMLSVLQAHWRATHVAAGTAVWMAMVVFAWYARPSQSGGTA
jgi:heme A synthase